jgi:hypothetical protein
MNQKMAKRASQTQVKLANAVKKIQPNLAKKATGDDSTVAIILALVSILVLPFGLHNWYLGRKKQALWQTLMVFPGFILLGIPALISWIWQIVDFVRLLANGELPS